MSHSRPFSATIAYENKLKLAIKLSKEEFAQQQLEYKKANDQLQAALVCSKAEADKAAQLAQAVERNTMLALRKSWEDEEARKACLAKQAKPVKTTSQFKSPKYRSISGFFKRSKAQANKLSVDEIYNHKIFDSIKI